MTKLFHNWDFLGSIGAAVAVVLPFIKTTLPFIQWLGALGGLVLLYYSIKNKRIESENLNSKK